MFTETQSPVDIIWDAFEWFKKYTLDLDEYLIGAEIFGLALCRAATEELRKTA